MDDTDLKKFFRAIGGELRRARKRVSMTQESVISHGLSARHFQMIEAGRPMTLRTFVKLCLIFDARPSSVIRAAEPALPRVVAAERVLGRGRPPTATGAVRRRRPARSS